jgi:hypothetical protein
MTKKYYIAYGSNLSVEQMAHRCPDAKVAGMAAIPDWKLVFRGCATIEPAKGRVVPVLIWEISERDERHLDAYEGYPSYYTKRILDVTMTDFKGKNPQEIQAMVYVMTDSHNKLIPPMKGYYDVLAKGYERFGFNQTMLRNALREARESAERGTAF